MRPAWGYGRPIRHQCGGLDLLIRVCGNGIKPRFALRAGSLAAGVIAAGLLGGCSTAGMLNDALGTGSPTSSTQALPASSDAIPPSLSGADDSEPVAKLYNEGLDHLKAGEYRSAAKSFSEVERQHPYSVWATRAILMQAYAQYQRNAYDEAVNAANRFITLHPGHKDAAYAYYLIALSNYEQINDVRRDQSKTQKALETLEEVSRRFPGTPYARDAEAKAALARDQLAAKEMDVGRFYEEKGSYLAGINRYKKVITDYQTTSHTPEALFRLTECYMALGVRSEAQTAAAVLGQNFPNSQWYKDAYALLQSDGLQPVENRQSWISRAWKTVAPF
jgi:outer membrane protein assembly factor BamD